MKLSGIVSGVRNRMNTLRQEADKANEKVDDLEKQVADLTQKLYETEKERDSFQRYDIIMRCIYMSVY
jgi:phage shock protein A